MWDLCADKTFVQFDHRQGFVVGLADFTSPFFVGDREITVWDLSTGQTLFRRLYPEQRGLRSVCFDSSPDRLLLAFRDGSISIAGPS